MRAEKIIQKPFHRCQSHEKVSSVKGARRVYKSRVPLWCRQSHIAWIVGQSDLVVHQTCFDTFMTLKFTDLPLEIMNSSFPSNDTKTKDSTNPSNRTAFIEQSRAMQDIVQPSFTTRENSCPSAPSQPVPSLLQRLHYPATSHPKPDVIVAMKNIHKTYMMGMEGVPALRGVSLEIYRGEWIVIFGTSGWYLHFADLH